MDFLCVQFHFTINQTNIVHIKRIYTQYLTNALLGDILWALLSKNEKIANVSVENHKIILAC